MLTSVPSALSRMTEEARVLDADSVHDALTGNIFAHSLRRMVCIVLRLFSYGLIDFSFLVSCVLKICSTSVRHLNVCKELENPSDDS